MQNEEGIVIGDAEAQVASEFTPQLSGFGMEKTVTVFNPLPVDFRVKYTRSVAANIQLDPNRQFTKDRTGMDLSKQGGSSAYVSHTIVLKAQSSTNLPGDIAQIAVQKLVSTIIQTRNDDGSYDFEGHGGRKGMVPDPALREEIEHEVIRSIKDTISLINQESPEAFTERQISELNEPEVPNDPAPGTGVNYTPKATVPSGAGQPSPTESSLTPKATVASSPK